MNNKKNYVHKCANVPEEVNLIWQANKKNLAVFVKAYFLSRFLFYIHLFIS